MYYEIYIDVVFATNLLMDYILLRLVGIFFRCGRSRRRTLLAAALGAFFSCLLMYFREEMFLPAAILLHGAYGLWMVMLGCGLKKGSLLVKAMVALYLAAFLLGGFLEAVTAGQKITPVLFFLLAGCIYLGLLFLVYLSDSLLVRRRHIYPGTLSWQGKTRSFYGFYDSGNLLRDPINGAPVSIVKMELLEEILPGNAVEKLKHLKEEPGEIENTEIAGLHPRFLPCHTVGGEGILLAVTLEKLCISTPGEVICVEKPVLGLAFGPSALSKEYEVLINVQLLQQEGEIL